MTTCPSPAPRRGRSRFLPDQQRPDRLALVRAEIAERDHGRAADRLALPASSRRAISRPRGRSWKPTSAIFANTAGRSRLRLDFCPNEMASSSHDRDVGSCGRRRAWHLSLAPDRGRRAPDSTAPGWPREGWQSGQNHGPTRAPPSSRSVSRPVWHRPSYRLRFQRTSTPSRSPAKPGAAGRKATQALADGLRKRGLHVEIRILGSGDVAKAA